MSNSQSLITDVFVAGEGVRRDARVTIAGVALLCDELMIPYGEVFWVSRRKGMLLLFAGRATLAIKGSSQELDQLYKLLTERVDLSELRRSIVRQLGHEVVLFTAGCAASGNIDGEAAGEEGRRRRPERRLPGRRQHRYFTHDSVPVSRRARGRAVRGFAAAAAGPREPFPRAVQSR
jgi:hypothetical protein